MTIANVDPLTHSHVFLGRAHDANTRRTLWVVALTAVMMVGEIIAGVVYGSMALLADGFHMATHAGALTVAALAYVYAKRNAANPRFSFGTGKVGDLAGFASALILGVVALAIAVESISRVLAPQTVAFGEATIVAVVGLVVNVVSAFALSGGAHHHGHAHDAEHHHDHPHNNDHDHMPASLGQDNNMRSAYMHVLADALTSVLAIVALLAGQFLGWNWLDPAMGVVGALVISRWSWTLMRESGAVLLDTTEPRLESEIRRRVESGTTRITDLHVWRIGPEAYAAIVSVTGVGHSERIHADLTAVPGLAHVTVECR